MCSIGNSWKSRGHDDVIIMETFSALLARCAGNSLVSVEFHSQSPVTRSFDVFFDLSLNKRLGKNREAGDLRRHRAHYDVTAMAASMCDMTVSTAFRNTTHLCRLTDIFVWITMTPVIYTNVPSWVFDRLYPDRFSYQCASSGTRNKNRKSNGIIKSKGLAGSLWIGLIKRRITSLSAAKFCWISLDNFNDAILPPTC